jgi:uncharacterized protein YecA (UPF0149 family)
MPLTPQEIHDYVCSYYLWQFDGKQAVFHALTLDDVRLWSPMMTAWVAATKTTWGVLFDEESSDVRRLSVTEALALTVGNL